MSEKSSQKLLQELRERRGRIRKAVVLGGGGAKGSYQIGVWKALRELEYDYEIVAGTSVGALNGALMVQGDYEAALALWERLKTENVIELPEGFLEHPTMDTLHGFLTEYFRQGGVDPAPLERLLRQYMDEEKIRSSPIEFGLVTVEYPSMKPLILTKSNIPEGKLCDYLMASAACFPAMKKRQIDDKKYIDGAYHNNVPIEIALDKGADEVVAVDLEALGFVRPVNLRDQKIRYVRCQWPLGTMLEFHPDYAKRNIRLGYLDTMKAFAKLEGLAYTFENGELSTCSEELGAIRRKFETFFAEGSSVSRLAWKRVGSAVAKRGGQEYLEEENSCLGPEAFGALEVAGELMGLSPEEIYTLEQFHALLLEKTEEAKSGLEQLLASLSIKVEQRLKDISAAKKLMETLKDNNRQFLVVFLMECMAGRYTLPGGADALNLLGAAFSRELAAAVYLTVLKEG